MGDEGGQAGTGSRASPTAEQGMKANRGMKPVLSRRTLRRARRAIFFTATALVLSLPLTLPSDGIATGTLPHWYGNGKLIVGSLQIKKSRAWMTFQVSGTEIACAEKERFGGVITNPVSGAAGTANLRAAEQRKPCQQGVCPPGPCYFFRVGLPSQSHLALDPPKPGVRDVMEGVTVSIVGECCKRTETYSASFTGAVEPKVGNGVLEFESEPLSGTETTRTCVEFNATEEKCERYEESSRPATLTVTSNLPLKGKSKKYSKITAG
jgi:hypothetical protein